jgi:hypothetical protein
MTEVAKTGNPRHRIVCVLGIPLTARFTIHDSSQWSHIRRFSNILSAESFLIFLPRRSRDERRALVSSRRSDQFTAEIEIAAYLLESLDRTTTVPLSPYLVSLLCLATCRLLCLFLCFAPCVPCELALLACFATCVLVSWCLGVLRLATCVLVSCDWRVSLALPAPWCLATRAWCVSSALRLVLLPPCTPSAPSALRSFCLAPCVCARVSSSALRLGVLRLLRFLHSLPSLTT